MEQKMFEGNVKDILIEKAQVLNEILPINSRYQNNVITSTGKMGLGFQNGSFFKDYETYCKLTITLKEYSIKTEVSVWGEKFNGNFEPVGSYVGFVPLDEKHDINKSFDKTFKRIAKMFENAKVLNEKIGLTSKDVQKGLKIGTQFK